jgi:hypothetical protein
MGEMCIHGRNCIYGIGESFVFALGGKWIWSRSTYSIDGTCIVQERERVCFYVGIEIESERWNNANLPNHAPPEACFYSRRFLLFYVLVIVIKYPSESHSS